MSKKKNRPPSAQNLIDSLLDEKTPPKAQPSAPDRYAPKAKAIDDDAVLFSDEKQEGAPAQVRSLPDHMDLTVSIAMDLQTENPEIASSYNHHKAVSGDSVVYPPRGAAPAQRSARPAPPPPPTMVTPEKQPEEQPEKQAEKPADMNDERTMRLDNVAPKRVKDAPEDGTSPLKTQGPQPILTRSEAIAKPAPITNETIDRMMPTEIKTRAQSSRDSKQKVAPSAYADGNGAGFSSAEASLKQSESLRIAQKRITDLEQELERLRRENENLGTAGDTLRRRSDELLTKSENLEIQSRENDKIHEEEKKVYRSQVQQKDRDLMEQRNRLEEMEGRLENNFKKIRVRERELEHRLEIIKMESATLVSGKDKMILDLKRQLDQLNHENDYGKQKSAELYNQYQGKQDTIRRVVRALRIALTILEGDEDASSGSSPRSSKRDE